MHLRDFMSIPFARLTQTFQDINIMYLKSGKSVQTLDIKTMLENGRTVEEIKDFVYTAINQHNKNFYKDFGSQTVYCEILFRDGGQAVIEEYDGNEYWSLRPGGDQRTRILDKIDSLNEEMKTPERQVSILQTALCNMENRATQVQVYCTECQDEFYANGGFSGFSEEEIQDLRNRVSAPCGCP